MTQTITITINILFLNIEILLTVSRILHKPFFGHRADADGDDLCFLSIIIN